MGRHRPDWWSNQQQQQDLEDGCPRNAANARERARMRVLSKAFSRLKTTLPWVPADTKLSKLDTLRLATTYIAHLSSLLSSSEQKDSSFTRGTVAVNPPNVVAWPYNVHNGVKEFSSSEDDKYDCYTLNEKSYLAYDSYYETINSQ
ncbi:transcription factor 21 isoform X2 [Daktulosphaira vitifoliae]|nr:transcription factor 21 isoform X2 [Daktulosphaira vitifoliae]XP_050543683.1 transcription factor 21 isoform X2 [Daktulosphaira vitifoliae]XP_050543684.1 transcription factor 21 isoform X2 [Daktulosphaira vitifoliae]XP_050543685.1 transcription factor 21 isoform X2 [Daktulosphaira vitifoliae]XP_050543686.1 transcription factor 21 isoform X2 [Daktulosphaira vitifoliae]XP_050543687.1 transcription factor 21 isoform X2 [Daktulosphaira vitifoliae]XP_050543688.1 transcription factor 21 isoform 